MSRDAATIDVEARPCGSDRTPDASVPILVSWRVPYLSSPAVPVLITAVQYRCRSRAPASRAVHRVDASVLCILPAEGTCLDPGYYRREGRNTGTHMVDPARRRTHPISSPRTSSAASLRILSILSLRIGLSTRPNLVRGARFRAASCLQLNHARASLPRLASIRIAPPTSPTAYVHVTAGRNVTRCPPRPSHPQLHIRVPNAWPFRLPYRGAYGASLIYRGMVFFPVDAEGGELRDEMSIWLIGIGPMRRLVPAQGGALSAARGDGCLAARGVFADLRDAGRARWRNAAHKRWRKQTVRILFASPRDW
ncbi:hypothetical protein B0H17DRAFT_1335953 [Mycena rosella]|uniref:Uncharacterized protein n=1 Tax=Mycena rosella TaxID=1033263 RepID=A0AAD7CX13_MYCRO|nr:hypothetical protein B0H17DRAFT_1335953 [Mycena rosella]